ncbi:PepSY domain-containing protein [Rhodophyticola sp. CCM32]|uniref:PepSY-associated TM helix domain-containing protein n=1 Tax=Rhodophyticola sp. CCM32 TaxID=2916397 RepID=UPI00107FB81A|nr:PepSY domain-containing protein [Rhodophyticola sp. CCM32]QBY01339.1 PepSY domain-containing protein [Rhodophyticola sp. CCM32]
MALTDQIRPDTGPATTGARARFYSTAWRWHFYAGLYVVPFLIMLAVTGLIMLYAAVIVGRDGEKITVIPLDTTLAVSAQAEAAQQAVPDGVLVRYMAPRSDDLAAVFRMDVADQALMVAVDPYRGDVLSVAPRRDALYDFVADIHGELLLGSTGDFLIEIAASLGMVLIATGLYLWWPRGTRLSQALVPQLRARGRRWWKSMHATIGVWSALLLAVFLVSGLSWAGVWGGKFVQAWSTFPAEKWGAPLSDLTHADMNHGDALEVPWALEQTPMPASGSQAGVEGLAPGMPVTIDSVVAFARSIGFDHRFQLDMPRDETGVWTIARDSMSNDSSDPTSDRTVHIDQYTGRILADVRFADYSIYGKGMAVGIAFHEGDMGLWNLVLNTVFCLSVVFLCVSGIVMWWMRRPAGAWRIVAPPLPRNIPLWRGAMMVGLVLAIVFPLAGLTLVTVFLIDRVLVAIAPAAKARLS